MTLRRNVLAVCLAIAAVLGLTRESTTAVIIPPWDLVLLLPNDVQAGRGHVLLGPGGFHEGFYLQTAEYPWDPVTRTGAYSNGPVVSEFTGADCPVRFRGVPNDFGRPGAGRDYQRWTPDGLVYLGLQFFGPNDCSYATIEFLSAPVALPRTLPAGGSWDTGITQSGPSVTRSYTANGELIGEPVTNVSTFVRFRLAEDTTTFPGITTLKYEAFLSCTETDCDGLGGPIAQGGAKKDVRWLTRHPGTVFRGNSVATGGNFGHGLARATFFQRNGTVDSFDHLCWTNPGASACDVFTDVPASHPFFAYVGALVRAGVTSGCSAVSPLFCPDTGTTRDQMAVFLLRSKFGGFYVPQPASTGCFQDVAPSNPFAPWICDLRERNVTSGCGPTTYCPGAAVTRRDMAIFLLRMRSGGGYQPQPPATACFNDVPLTDYAAPFICELKTLGITGGCDVNNNYCPNNTVSRGQMAVFLTRTFSLPF